MYAAPRRIRWGATFSCAVRATQGALPGCSVAMHLLQLIMILPFDVYQASITQIPHTLDIYADDITLQIMLKADGVVQAAQAAIGRLAVVLQALGLPIAKDKAKILGSAEDIAAQVARGVSQYGFQVVNKLS
eukprot:7304335-Pyramimonas_sp.AAC.1